jgi:ELWxxDGT repeat protein
MKTFSSLSGLLATALAPLAIAASPAPAVALPASAPTTAVTYPAPVLLARTAAGTGVEFRGRFYFPATGVDGRQIWSTDGTPGGTHEAIDNNVGVGSSDPTQLVVYGDRLLFRDSTPATGSEWFTSDGTTAGTHVLKDINPGQSGSSPGPAVLAGGRLYFAATDPALGGRGLWVTDGSDFGTNRAQPVSNPTGPVSLDDRVVYAATDAQGARKPYVTFTADERTSRLDHEAADVDLNPHDFVRFAGRAYFVAGSDDQGNQHGEELWLTSTTTADATEVEDVYPGFHDSLIEDITPFAGRVWFPGLTPDEGLELWSSTATDTSTSTSMAADILAGDDSSSPANLRSIGTALLFDADDGVHGKELWSSDSTGTDVHLVRDISPGPGDGVDRTPDPLALTVGARSVFSGTDAAGTEPWVSDGTAAGTVRLADLTPGAGGSAPYAVGRIARPPPSTLVRRTPPSRRAGRGSRCA